MVRRSSGFSGECRNADGSRKQSALHCALCLKCEMGNYSSSLFLGAKASPFGLQL